jgi:hypothetical protein
MSDRYPAVTRLALHLEHQQKVYFRDNNGAKGRFGQGKRLAQRSLNCSNWMSKTHWDYLDKQGICSTTRYQMSSIGPVKSNGSQGSHPVTLLAVCTLPLSKEGNNIISGCFCKTSRDLRHSTIWGQQIGLSINLFLVRLRHVTSCGPIKIISLASKKLPYGWYGGGVRTPFGMGWQSCEREITEIIFQVCMNYYDCYGWFERPAPLI